MESICLTTRQQAGQPRRSTFIPYEPWLDDRGVPINAHGGGVLFHERVYYWYGEHKIAGEAGNVAHVGVHVYASTDLYNWRDEGIALAVSNDSASDIVRGCVLERPKVLWCAGTRRFVMWFHLELAGQGYGTGRVGVAVAEQPTGPFVFVHSFRPNAGHFPRNVTAEQRAALSDRVIMADMRERNFRYDSNPETPRYPIVARDFVRGQDSRDMTLFLDDDGQAFHICASEINSTLHISRLSDDFLTTTGDYVRVFPCRWHEAPAVCRHGGRYWMVSSDCTGWAPNAARSAVADCIWGPWTELGNPMRGSGPAGGAGPEKTFGGQSTFILPVQGRVATCIAMFDIWRPENAIDGRYMWLPMRYSDGRVEIPWKASWALDEFDVPEDKA
jgi:hypothetical protein